MDKIKSRNKYMTKQEAFDEFTQLRNDDYEFCLQYDEDEFEDWVKDQEIKIDDKI